jgi:hypothetical protein
MIILGCHNNFKNNKKFIQQLKVSKKDAAAFFIV